MQTDQTISVNDQSKKKNQNKFKTHDSAFYLRIT